MQLEVGVLGGVDAVGVVEGIKAFGVGGSVGCVGFLGVEVVV